MPQASTHADEVAITKIVMIYNMERISKVIKLILELSLCTIMDRADFVNCCIDKIRLMKRILDLNLPIKPLRPSKSI